MAEREIRIPNQEPIVAPGDSLDADFYLRRLSERDEARAPHAIARKPKVEQGRQITSAKKFLDKTSPAEL